MLSMGSLDPLTYHWNTINNIKRYSKLNSDSSSKLIFPLPDVANLHKPSDKFYLGQQRVHQCSCVISFNPL